MSHISSDVQFAKETCVKPTQLQPSISKEAASTAQTARAYMPQSLTDDWATPQATFDKYNAYHHFDLDVAASSTNHKTERWLGLDHPDPARRDGLTAEWDGEHVWCNPPYGRGIALWVKKAAEHAFMRKGEVVLLLPARTDTAWFHDYCIMHAVEFLRGRLKFGKAINSAPFPSMIVRMK